MPGHAKNQRLSDLAQRYFISRGGTIEEPIGYAIDGQDPVLSAASQIYPLFRVTHYSWQGPRPVFYLTGNWGRKVDRLIGWLDRLKRAMGIFVVDDLGSLYYVEGCPHCSGIGAMTLETFLSGPLCQHSTQISKMLPVKIPPGGPLLHRLYLLTREAGKAISIMDIGRGAHDTMEKNGQSFYLISPKQCAALLGVSSTDLREAIISVGGGPLRIRRWGRLRLFWTLPETSPGESGEGDSSFDL